MDKAGFILATRLVPPRASAADNDSSWPWCDLSPGNEAVADVVRSGASSDQPIGFPDIKN